MHKILLLLPFLLLSQIADVHALQRDDIVFNSGDLVIHGTLTLPEGGDPAPVVLYLGGVNEYGRYDEQRGTFIAEVLEGIFPAKGVGVMYYDPRGLGETEGRWQRTTIGEFTRDARAAITYLRSRRDVDPERIGVIAKDEDGWVAYELAGDNVTDLSFVISMNTPPFDARQSMINQYYNNYLCTGQDSAVAMTKAERKAGSHQNWVNIFPITKRWRHMKLIKDYDPAEALKEINTPVLLMYGENDGQLYPGWVKDSLFDIFSGDLPDNYTMNVINGANHDFKVADRCYVREDALIDKNYSSAFKDSLAGFVTGMFFESFNEGQK